MIQKREYNKALKIVKCYEEQIKSKSVNTAKEFGFIWHDNDNVPHYTWIKAKNIDSACKKFLRCERKTMMTLDYEVQVGKEYIDISERKEFKNWL